MDSSVDYGGADVRFPKANGATDAADNATGARAMRQRAVQEMPDRLPLFAGQLGWLESMAVENLNVSPNRPAAADIPATTREAITELNALVVEPHAFAVDVLDRRLSAAGLARAPGLFSRIFDGGYEAVCRSAGRAQPGGLRQVSVSPFGRRALSLCGR